VYDVVNCRRSVLSGRVCAGYSYLYFAKENAVAHHGYGARQMHVLRNQHNFGVLGFAGN
jgi:hypothetical protein